LSPARKTCTSCNRYGLMCKHHLNTRHTVVMRNGKFSAGLTSGLLRATHKTLEFFSRFPLKCMVALCSHPYRLSPQIVGTNDEYSVALADQCWNAVEMHAEPHLWIQSCWVAEYRMICVVVSPSYQWLRPGSVCALGEASGGNLLKLSPTLSSGKSFIHGRFVVADI
jgi:hypothetical protein